MKKVCMVVAMALSLCVEAFGQERGSDALWGIDTIPLDAIHLSNEQMKDLFIVTDAYSRYDLNGYSIEFLKGHHATIQRSACAGYIISCDHTDPSTLPFSFFAKYPLPQGSDEVIKWLLQKIEETGGKIVTTSGGPIGRHNYGYRTAPFVFINPAGNERHDNFFQIGDAVYDRKRGVFVRNGQILDRHQVEWMYNSRDAVESGRVIYATSYTLDGREDVVPVATGCLGIEESCVWLPESMLSKWTSTQSSRLGSTLASLLAVFPGYDVFDMAALTSACAVPHPNLAGGGIVNIPCMIETICEETENKSSAYSLEQPVMRLSWVNTDIGVLENPTARPGILYTERSGISVISGWVCEADEITIEINGTPFQAGYRTTRFDTVGTCGDDDNGFSLLYNWNLLKNGLHTVEAFADGVKFASTLVKVVTLGEEMAHGISESSRSSIVPIVKGSFANKNHMFQWNHSMQNFVIVPHNISMLTPPLSGYANTANLRAVLENPPLGSYQSGVSTISGWVCDAEEVIIELNGTPFRAGYGTSRFDTVGACGDDDNGFSLLYNWNLLGNGIHTIEAFADGMKFASTQVRVTTLGEEFLRNADGAGGAHFPASVGGVFSDGTKSVKWKWVEALQNFVIIGFGEFPDL